MKKRDRIAVFMLTLLVLILTLPACGGPAARPSEEPQTVAGISAEAEKLTASAPETGSGTDAAADSEDLEGKRILIIETTDIHGWLLDASSGKPETFQYRLARIAHDINEARQSGEYDDVLLLDGGDLYQGPPVSNMTYGGAIRAAIDAMDYDAVALGNHEFDWDVTQYCADAEGTVAPYELGEYSGDPDIPVLASNLYDAQSGERVPFTQDYTIVEKAGLDIAVIGYIPDYRGTIMGSKIAPYVIDADLKKLDALVREVHETEKSDVIVILTHGDPKYVANAMDPALVSLVLGGHTHRIAAGTATNGIPYAQGSCHAQGYASAVLVVRGDRNRDRQVLVEGVTYTDITENKEALYDTEKNLDSLDETVLDIA